MSLLRYNSVTLPYSNFTKFRQEALRDEMSDTDWYLQKFDIETQCLIDTDYLAALAPDLIGQVTDPATIMQVIRARLMVHRKQLSVTFNGNELIPQIQEGINGTVDAQNGPKPQSCDFVEMTNKLFVMRYHIVAHYWENNEVDEQELVQNKQGNTVLTNRWSETVDIDNRNFTTRTRDGKFIIRSDNTKGLIADQVRSQMAVVGVPDDFLRLRSHYKVDPSGLAIQYQVVDQEIFKKPPDPAFKAQGYYRESTTINGAKRYGEVFIHLEGDRQTSQVKLMKAAIDVAAGKLAKEGSGLTGNKNRGFEILENAVMHEDLYDNVVEFSIRALIAADPARLKVNDKGQFTNIGGQAEGLNAINGFNGISTFTPRSDPNYHPKYFDRGTASILLQAAKYYDPNLVDTELAPARITSDNDPVTTTGDNTGKLQLSRGKAPGTAGKNKE